MAININIIKNYFGVNNMDKYRAKELEEKEITVYTYNRFFNGDFSSLKGKIVNISSYDDKMLVRLSTQLGIKTIPLENIYEETELDKMKEKIKLIELARLPEEIKNLEEDLKNKKRKFKKLLEETN